MFSFFSQFIRHLIKGSPLFLLGLIIILGLPVMSFWIVELLSGIAMLVKGLAKMTIALANKNNY